MVKRIVGRIALLNDDGESDREISVNLGERGYVGGTFGGLEIEANVSPPRIRGKGNVFIEGLGDGVRTTRLQEGQELKVGISANGQNITNIGSLKIV